MHFIGRRTAIAAGAIAVVALAAVAMSNPKPQARADEVSRIVIREEKVELSSENFPDEDFRQSLETYDLNEDGFLQKTEIAEIKSLNLNSSGIKDLTGIGYLSGLEELYCSECEITEIDLEGCYGLKELDCSSTNLTKIDVSLLSNLTYLDISDTRISKLDLCQNKKLESLSCMDTDLASLEIKWIQTLKNLKISGTKISRLNITSCKALVSLVKYTDPEESFDEKGHYYEYSRQSEEFGFCFLSCNQETALTTDPIPTLTPYPACTVPDVTSMKLEDAYDKVRKSFRSPAFCGTYIYVELAEGADTSKDLYVKEQSPAAGTTRYGNHSSFSITLTVENKSTANPSPTNSAKPTPQPNLSTPQNVNAVAESTSSIKISWDSVPYASGYQVFRSTSATSGFTSIGCYKDLSKVSVGLKAGTTYYYKVRAYVEVDGQKHFGGYSSVVSAMTKLAKPAGVNAVPVSSTSIKVSWNQVTGATGYQVFRSTSATSGFTSIGCYTDLSKVSVGLKGGTTYYYKVRAYVEVDGQKYFGGYSSVVSAMTKLAKPAGVKAASASATSVKISWNTVAGATGYQVFRSTSATSGFKSIGSYTDLSKVSTGLVTGTKYYYKVRAYVEKDGSRNYSDYSAVVSAIPVPAAPSNVKAVSASATSIKVSWNKVAGATGYQVFRSTSATSGFSSIGSYTDLSKVSVGLKTGTTYYYKVRAYTEVDGTRYYGAYSTVVSAKPTK